jgi:predicted ArsR family transcriptional regulator
MDDRWIERLFSNTRGRIVHLLRRQDRTVSDLADALDLTANAIRSQLTKLERDELVKPTGKRPGIRKPEIVYGLTEQADTLFPKIYDDLLDQLLRVLAERGENLEELLRSVGRRLADQYRNRIPPSDSDARIEQTCAVLEEIGGVSEIEAGEDGTTVVRGRNCPFKAVVPHHPAVCAMTETFLAHLSDMSVCQDCEPGGEAPQCRFVFQASDRTSNGAG